MTKKQRAQVAKLLRCAADYYDHGFFGCNGIGTASSGLGLDDPHDPIWETAVQARRDADRDGSADYAISCLKAAARVEEGLWP